MQSSLPEIHQETSVAVPPVPLKTYQWEEVKRARKQGGYPWTHLDKGPLEGEDITAESVLKNSDPRKAMATSQEPQKILLLDASPGSSRRHADSEGDETPVHVPNFSKEISLDSEEDTLEKDEARVPTPDTQPAVKEPPKIPVSPKGILKRKLPDKNKPLSEESPRNSKCCHPFVEKIKHIADITINKVEKVSPKKDGFLKKKHIDEKQEIINLDCSPGSERRERQKLAAEQKNKDDQDEKVISLVMNADSCDAEKKGYSPILDLPILDSSPSSKRKKEHIYEDIEKNLPVENDESMGTDNTNDVNYSKNHDTDTKSFNSMDPSLMIDEPMDEDSVTESVEKIKSMYDTSMTPDKLIPDIQPEAIISEPNETSSNCENDITTSKGAHKDDSPDITITEVTEDGLSDRHLNLDAIDENIDGNVAALDRRVHFDMSDSTGETITDQENVTNAENDNLWSKISDHEYEPIGKPTTDTSGPSEATAMNGDPEVVASGSVQVTQEDRAPSREDDTAEWAKDDASSTTSQERQFLRPPPEEDNEAFSATDGEGDSHNAAMLLQKEIEDRYFVNTPTTTESRTDCEISTSQVDSSAIEDLPLKRENRKKNAVGQESKLQQKIKSQTGRIRSQAGKLKTKLKTIKKPQFNMPERPKFERPKFNMPERPKFERPKFTMPERPKFNLPERPKFNFPERPKFNLPERPKFNLPDRPKINFPDKSKFRLPERPKMNLPDRPKINFPDRPKFNFPDRPKFSLPDRSKFKFPDRPKINLSTFSRNKENTRKDSDDKTTESTSGSKKQFLDFDFRTYPRIFSRNKKEKKDPNSSVERPGTPPPGFATVPRMNRQQVVASHWEHASSRTTDDEPRHYGIDYSYDNEPDFQTKLAQVDKDYRKMQQEEAEKDIDKSEKPVQVTLENKELWNAMERAAVQQMEHGSSMPQISSNRTGSNEIEQDHHDDDESSAASTGQHRRGVLEEIDNDEFFLRQKGISQDNIEVGKYLSNEIRDAFRSPVNALSQMDRHDRYPIDNDIGPDDMDIDNDDNVFYKYKDDDENNEQFGYDDETNNNVNAMTENDDGYYTFPPVRPSRAKKLKAMAQETNKDSCEINEPVNETIIQTVRLESIPPPNIFSEPPLKSFEIENNLENFRKNIFGNSFKEPEILENLNEYENEMEQVREIPTIPKRRRKNPKEYNFPENESLTNDDLDKGDWNEPLSIDEKNNSDEIIVHRVEHIIPSPTDIEEFPTVPRRMRSRSRGSRATSVGDDDRTSRGAESLTLDSHTQLATVDLDFMDDNDECPGYAIVDKLINQKKDEPPPRPPAPIRRHRSAKSLSGDRQFFTVPRALKESTPPRRPLRNYSTLGPSKPPRKKSTTSLTALDSFKKTSSGDVTQYVEIEDELDDHKNLKSGEIISKMKDRPLPPPPRPPRGPKKKKELEKKESYDDNFENGADIDIDDLSLKHIQHDEDGSNFDDFETRNINNSYNIHNEHIDFETEHLIDNNNNNKDDRFRPEMYDQEEIIEIEVSTQTDPLPDDFDYDLGMEEPLSDHIACTPDSVTDLTKEEAEENSIDVEILSRGLQKFRESSRPNSRCSKPRTPIERPKTPLGRMSPTAVLIERRVSSPTRINQRKEIVTEASLTVLPIDEPCEAEIETSPPVHQYYPTVYPHSLQFIHLPQTNQIISQENVISDKPTQKSIVENEQSEPCVNKNESRETESDQAIVPSIDQSNIVDSQPYKVLDQPIESISQLEIIDPIETISPQTRVFDQETCPIQLLQPETMTVSMDIDNQAAQSRDDNRIVENAQSLPLVNNSEVEVLRTQRLQVSDLDVERLTVSELQAQKILVSEIEGLSLQVSDLNSKSGHIYVRGFELAPGIIEDILEKFSQLVPPSAPPQPSNHDTVHLPRPDTNQETQTEDAAPIRDEQRPVNQEPTLPKEEPSTSYQEHLIEAVIEEVVHPVTESMTSSNEPPERPPLPQIHPSLYMPHMACYPEYSLSPASFYRLRNMPTERHADDLSDTELPPAPSRRRKPKREPISSSDDEEYNRPISRRAPPQKPPEASVSELSIQLFRACQNSVSRTVNHILSYITSHFGGGEDKKDVQMALVIFLVMIAGLIMLGVGDGRTVHHHHWDFFNPPNSEK